jgi:hypothetical protein
MRFGLSSSRTHLTKFLSASNQIVKDLGWPPLPPEGRKNDQPASKLCAIQPAFSFKTNKRSAMGFSGRH